MSDKDDIVYDSTIRIIVDDVSGGKRTEFRASIWDGEGLLSEGWGGSVAGSVQASVIDWEVQ